MKAITCLLALSVFAGLATSEFAWKTGKSYTYAVRGRLMNGVSEINTQYAGLEVDYKVVLTVTGDRVVNWKATDFKLFEVNDVIKGGWRDGELRNERPVELTNEVREYLESPMDITFNRGVIESIKVDSRLPVWAINMKKAQASDFILDTTGVNTVMVGNLNRKTSHVRPEERNIESGYFYETMEKSIHGECNTYYTVSQNAAFKRPFPFQRNAQPGVVSHEVEDEELLEVESHEHKTHDNEHSQDIVRELSWHKTFNTFCEKKDQVYEIIKSVNFTACVNKPVLAFTAPSMHLDSRPGDNGVGTVASRSLITRFLACGKDRKQFTILKIRQEELVKVGLHITKKIVNGALKNLTLIELTDAKAPVPVNNPKMINNIVYNFVVRKNTHHDEEMLMDAAYMNEKESHEETMETTRDAVLPKPTLKEAPVLPMLITPLKVEEMKKRVETLVREIVMDIVKPNGKETMAEKETLDKINTVSKILRRFNYDVIEALYHKLADKRETLEDKTSRNIFLDCVAIAGTNPNVKFLLDLIEKKQVVGERACQILMTLPMYIRTPTKELLKAYFHLLKSDVLRTENKQLLTTAILSFSTVLYESCMNTRIRNSRFPVALFGKFCDAQIVEQEYLPWFLEHLEKNIKSDRVEDHHWRFVFLKALGNIGHPAFIPVVQRLMDNVSNPLLKTKVIWALQHMIVSRSAHNVERKFPIVDRDGHDIITNEVVEKKVLPILMSCAFDKGEHPEVRMAAITLLFYTTNADRTIWQQLAYMTWFEVSEEVHSLIYKTLKSLTDLKHPMHKVHRNMHLKALQVLHLCKPITPGMTKSRMVIMADHIPEFLTGFVHHWTYFGSKDSMIPNMMHYNNFYQIGENGLGFNPIEISFHGHTVQKLINHVIEQFVTPRMADREVHEDLTHIREILQIKDRQMKEKVEGVFFLKIRDELERMFTVNKDVIEKYAKKLMTETLPKLKNGIEINYQKTFRFYELTMEFPTIFGLPLNFKSVMPVHVSLRGNLKINAEENLKDMQLQADLHPVYAWKQHDKLSFKVPFLTKKYQTGIMNHMVAEIPFRALVRRAPRGQVIVAITPTHIAENREPTEELNLVTYHQKPYTVVITDDCWPTTHKEGGEIKVIRSIETPYHKEHIFAEKRLGLSMKFKEESDFRVERETKSSWYHFWQRFHTPSGFFNLGYLGTPTVRLSLRKLTLDMSRSETKTLALVLGGNWRHFWTRHHHEDAEEKRVLTIALIGKKMPIEAAKKTTGIQKILTKGTESTINYLLEITKPYGKLNLRLAAGEACKEAANKLPENIESLRAIKEYIVECPLQKIQRDLCVELRGEFVRPNWANRRELIVLRKRLLSEDLLVNLNAELKFGKLCTELPHEIKMEGKLRRGSKMTEWARTKSPQAKKCIEDEKKGFSVSPVCLWVSEQQAAALNKGNLVFTFTDLPVAFKNYTYMIEDWTKAMLYPYVSHDRFPQNGGAGEKKLIVDFEMVPDREFITVHINKPTARLSFRDVHVSKFYKRFLPLTATQSIWENVRDRTLRFYSEPSCTLEGRFINTFDNVTYSFKKDVATGCTHVLTKDCSGKYPMAVLVKDIHAERKTVTVLLGEKTKIKISNGGSRVARFEREENMKVEVNKEVITNFPKIIREHESDRLIAKIEVMVNGGIQVITPRIRVATDGVRVVVYGHNMYRNRTCGLCGDFDGERIAEMRSPKNCPLSTGSLLVASYAFPALHAEANNECKIKPEIKELIKKEDEDCLAHRTMLATEEKDSEEKSSEEKSSEEEFHEDECNIKKTLNKRFPGFGMCVSQNELHRCAPGCHAEKTHQKNVLFKCTEQGRFTKVTLKKFLIEMPVNCVRAM